MKLSNKAITTIAFALLTLFAGGLSAAAMKGVVGCPDKKTQRKMLQMQCEAAKCKPFKLAVDNCVGNNRGAGTECSQLALVYGACVASCATKAMFTQSRELPRVKKCIR